MLLCCGTIRRHRYMTFGRQNRIEHNSGAGGVAPSAGAWRVAWGPLGHRVRGRRAVRGTRPQRGRAFTNSALLVHLSPRGGRESGRGEAGGAIAPARGSKDFIIWCGCVCLAHAHGFAEAFPSDSNAPVVVPFLFFTFHLCGRASLTNRNQETILANRETPRVLRCCQ